MSDNLYQTRYEDQSQDTLTADSEFVLRVVEADTDS